MEVIVLAGGLGTRLRSVVHDIPKCMAPVAGEPFLHYLLDWLSGEGATHVIFSVGYLREQVMSYVQDCPFKVDFAIEEEPLGTGGGIRLALQYCTEDKVFVVNGDTFYPVPLHLMPSLSPITLALKPMKDFDRYGAVECDGARISAFREKQFCAEGLINGGVYCLRPSALDWSGMAEKFSFERDVLEPMASQGALTGWVSNAYFLDIGIPEDYARAQQELPEWMAVKKASEAVLAADADTLFLDRDGVINRLIPGDYVRNTSQFVFLPGILQALAEWSAKFKYIILVTNQRGVGKGLMTDADLSRIHACMMSRILEAGGRIDLILTCTAVDENDPRRKPQTGMFFEAVQLFSDIRPERSIMLGDSQTDADFARNCNMEFIKVESPERP